MRTIRKYSLENNPNCKEKLLQWAQQFNEITWLDSNADVSHYKNYEAILAVEANTKLTSNSEHAFQKLQDYRTQTPDWIFGYFSYDLKNGLEELTSKNFDGLHFPELVFFQPKKIFLFKNEEIELHYLPEFKDEMDFDWQKIIQAEIPSSKTQPTVSHLQPRISKEEYIKKVGIMRSHIHLGAIYEANFCQEFFAENCKIKPLDVYQKLNEISTPPFASFFKYSEFNAMCASPERYLKRIGNKVISQPIKGTAKRSENLEEDLCLQKELKTDPKEISENIMIVDLVRNDLSKTAKRGSVNVEELCEVYTFKQVHQLISTIVSEVESDLPSTEILKTTFPMGSMTGAPKISAMKIIENLEESKRGLYSGAIGYLTPEDNFDFNVVIRSILYNSKTGYVSYSVGSAITDKSVAEKEYEECLVKAKAMRNVLLNKSEI